MRIRITKPDPDQSDMWFNKHIGEEFDVIRYEGSPLPPRFYVDIQGVGVDFPSAPQGAVWDYCAELVEDRPEPAP